MGKKTRRLGASPEDIVFDTKMDIGEQEKAREVDSLKDFDRLLEKEVSEFE